MKKTLKDIFFAAENIMGFLLIGAVVLVPTGLYKKMLPKHPVINQPAIYFCKGEKEDYYCDFRQEELPSRFADKIICKSFSEYITPPVKINVKEYKCVRASNVEKEQDKYY